MAEVTRHRRHHRPGRHHRYLVTYDDEENARIVAAAKAAGLTATGYVAVAALATADNTRPPMHSPARDLLAELTVVGTQLRRVGGNLNQMVARFNTTGQAPTRLDEALRIVLDVVARVDRAADNAAGKLP